MTFREGWSNLRGNFRRKPARVVVGLMTLALWKLLVFWFNVMMAGGFVAILMLYLAQDIMPYMGYEAITIEAIERMRTFSLIIGFAVVFFAFCFRVVMRLTLGREPKVRKRPLWFFQNPSLPI